ncbi:MAG: efflux RND transporter periplasmic adaptor subunit [Rhodothermaceae bacterium]
MKVSVKIVFAVVLVITLGIVGYSYIPVDEKPETEEITDQKEVDYEKLEEVVFDVIVEPVKMGTLVKRVKANGTVKAFDEIEIEANTSGFIKKINVFDGKQVKAGELLVKLDDTEKKIDLANAEDDILKSQIDYKFLKGDVQIDSSKMVEADRLKEELAELENQYKSKQISGKKYKTAKDSLQIKLIYTGTQREKVILNKSGLNAAVNKKKKAELQLSYTEIRAPFAGLIGNCDLSIGEKINQGKPVLKLFAVNKLKIEVGVLENEILMVKKGAPARVTLNAIPGKMFEGKVIYVSPYIDEETKTCKVTVEVENKDLIIKPGMFAKVELQAAVLENRILIPKKALLIRDKRPLVFTVEEELAKWKYVKLGEENDEFYEVKSGINKDEKLVIQGHYNLAHDAKVKVIK